MAADTQIPSEPASSPGMSTLLEEIFRDVEDLLKQQMALFRHEVRADVNRTATAAVYLTVGAVISLIGVGLLSLMLAYLLNSAIPALPLWACFGLVGLATVSIGVALACYGRSKFRTLNLLPEESMAALRENLAWTRKPN